MLEFIFGKQPAPPAEVQPVTRPEPEPVDPVQAVHRAHAAAVGALANRRLHAAHRLAAVVASMPTLTVEQQQAHQQALAARRAELARLSG